MIVRGPVIPEPIQVVAVVPMGAATQIMGKSLTTGQFHDPIVSKEQVGLLLRDQFREPFEVIRGDSLRANCGTNPWQERDQVVTSVSWVSRVEDARESLLRSDWDLIIVDEAHKMSAGSTDKKTLADQPGEHLSEMTDHFLLMTASPHKGDPDAYRQEQIAKVEHYHVGAEQIPAAESKTP